MIFRKKTRVQFSQVDAAGILFFGRFFALAHDAFEEWLLMMGFSWGAWFQNPDWLVPLRHVEADYFKPLRGGEEYEIEVSLVELKESSFQARFRFFQGEALHAELRHFHVFVDPRFGGKIPIPGEVRRKLMDRIEPQDRASRGSPKRSAG